MRRVFAISLAILVVTLAARGVMAQDSQQDGNDLLLKILKEKNILSDEQAQEIQGMLAEQKSETDQKLTALDSSLSDYLAKRGDSFSGNTTYVQNQGVTFNGAGGNWSVFFGGLFQFAYAYQDGDNVDSDGGFAVRENRFDFGGTIFDQNLDFYTQIQTVHIGESLNLDDVFNGADLGPLEGFFGSGNAELQADFLLVLDAYLDWQFCDVAALQLGKFKVPYGRQSQVDVSDRAFGGSLNLAASYFRLGSMGRDTGLMFHSVSDGGDPHGLAFEWAAGVWNGSGGNLGFISSDTWLMWGLRGGVYPWGMVDYVEGDWARSPDIKAGIAASIFMDEFSTGASGDNPSVTSWEVDGVATWNGLYLTAEYFSQNLDDGSNDITNTGWYVQGGYFVTPELEVLGSYGMVDFDNDDSVSEWKLGGAWYFDGHEWKVAGSVGQQTYSPDSGSDTDDWFIELILQADW
jgi:hypothetical protein